MTTQLTEPAARTWQADPYADALRLGRGPLYLRRRDGWLLPLDVERWCAEPDAAGDTVLARCTGRVLDIGCGPGRLVAALARLGRTALGVDVTPEGVARTVRAGGSALCRSVFDPLPGVGGWSTVLLIDGNIDIGGDPAALLRRARELTAPGGSLLVEVATADVDERSRAVRGKGAMRSVGPRVSTLRASSTWTGARERAENGPSRSGRFPRQLQDQTLPRPTMT
ncbi:class I SAM-dependent methyltransferase [Streptomyces amritsarensis]|uniref:class I SAM-dependent methyltransferase n=1 Tax=Streptomyces amritsarensis TaxID=681158 RepID=UPI0036BF17DB